ncbi:LppU/SCO3897 family protein [Phytomonospora endophytica]|uniref:Uncharacterized protein n=1 Tax=Phytomonospora endophytica TaxID=714109 RepID=A0A841FGZ0_9ACTN|nr:hypothetical protein [Phytomonospora endophytica]MBB6032822.1 hypothetical protein [Phytomonospora endophytica]GIG66029.1 hypothetical protein Pen01_23240 [Phytomonospora endophytica]
MAQQPPPGNYPPPPGGQYPPPGGQPPPGGFPPPGGQPPPPGGFPPPPPPAKKGGGGKIAAIVGVVVVGIIVLVLKFGIGAIFNSASELDAKVGDCLDSPSDPNDTSIVDCSDAEAVYTVTSVEQNPGTDSTTYCLNDEAATQYLAEGESLTNPDVIYCIASK